jgi:hypothetical protein
MKHPHLAPFIPKVPPRLSAWQELLETLHMREDDALRSILVRDWVRKHYRTHYLPPRVLEHFHLTED